MTITIKSPGKLILSGEHAVVYGASALAIAVSRYLTLSFTTSNVINSHGIDQKKIAISSPLGETIKTLNELDFLCDELNQKHQCYLNNELTANDLLEHPHDLIFYVLAHSQFEQSGHIHIKSDIPLGAGMGSSAAAIASTLALCLHLNSNNENKTINLADCTQQIKWCERLQHGKGSLIDAAAISYGGFIEVCQSKVNVLSTQLSEKQLAHWFVWNTGIPSYSTKEVVSYVEEKQYSPEIWKQFDQVTQRFKQILNTMDDVDQSNDMLQQVIKDNHQLLCQIGVVPDPVRKQIDWINQCHGAAKVCGAGSLPNDSVAGQVLVYLPCLDSVKLLQQKGIELSPVIVSYDGFAVTVN